MTKKKLKNWVIPTLSTFILTGCLLCYYLISNIMNYNSMEPTYVSDLEITETKPVNNEIEPEIMIKPINGENVNIEKYYYNRDDDETKQQQSLIKYQNIYMPNTGILYSSDNEFEIISVLDGKVTNIKEDDILGNILEIEHNNRITTIYQSIKDIKVKVGDTVKKGDVIATSGTNKLENLKTNNLHFETYKNNTLVNPESLIEKNINEVE